MKLDREGAAYRLTRTAAGVIGAALMRLLVSTWRVEFEGENPLEADDGSGAFVLVLWHRGLFAALAPVRDRGIVVPVSRSRDGDWISGVLVHMGFAEPPRGSTSSGASTLLRNLVKQVRAGNTVAILPDGPRGPAGKAQPGVVALARMTGARLIPLGAAARPAWEFGSWDRAILPRPFARVRLHFGPPIVVPKGSGTEEMGSRLSELEASLYRLDREAESALG